MLLFLKSKKYDQLALSVSFYFNWRNETGYEQNLKK